MTHLHALSSKNTFKERNQSTLLEAVATGDRAAFWSLWQINYHYLYHRCLQWMNYRRHDADEALSQAMVKAWEKLPRYANQIQNLRAWLSRLTYHVCMDFYRENNHISYSLDESCGDRVSHYDKFASEVDSPESSLQRCELSSVIQHAIANLPERLREPCLLRFCENWSYPQLAAHFNMSEATARKRIQQARAILRRHIAPYLQGQTSGKIKPLLSFQSLNIA